VLSPPTGGFLLKGLIMAMQLSMFDCCRIIEGFDGEEHTEEEVIEAFQALIDSGQVWKLQGFYGRTAARLIDAGLCFANQRS